VVEQKGSQVRGSTWCFSDQLCAHQTGMGQDPRATRGALRRLWPQGQDPAAILLLPLPLSLVQKMPHHLQEQIWLWHRAGMGQRDIRDTISHYSSPGEQPCARAKDPEPLQLLCRGCAKVAALVHCRH